MANIYRDFSFLFTEILIHLLKEFVAKKEMSIIIIRYYNISIDIFIGSDSVSKVKVLIENGANANIQDNNGYSSLALALKNGETDCH